MIMCTQKLRNKNNTIIAYELSDGNTKMLVTPDELRGKLIRKTITVSNLKLTSDNRIISTSNKAESVQTKKKQINKKYTDDEIDAIILKSKLIGFNSIVIPDIEGVTVLLKDKLRIVCIKSEVEVIEIAHLIVDPIEFVELNFNDADIKIIGGSGLKVLDGFMAFITVGDVDLTNLDTRNVTSMNNTFRLLKARRILGIETLDTSKVTNMISMFNGLDCSKFSNNPDKEKTLDIRNFNISSVEDMSLMFGNIKNIEKIEMSGLCSDSLKNVHSMFENAEVNEINISNFSANKLTDARRMFSHCKVDKVNIDCWNACNVRDMSEMFNGSEINSIDISKLKTGKVKFMFEMFINCRIPEMDLSGFDTHNVESMFGMFAYCKTRVIDVSNFDTSKVTTMSGMFASCKSNVIGIEKLDTSKVDAMSEMFRDFEIEELDLSNFNIDNLNACTRMFSLCKIHRLNIKNFKLNNRLIKEMFKNAENAEIDELDLSNSLTSSELASLILISKLNTVKSITIKLKDKTIQL